jgi:antitoxin YobK
MELAEFEALAEPLRRRPAALRADHGFALIEGHTATAREIASVERDMGVALPGKYKSFMMRYGGGAFGFVELFPVAPAVRV